MTPTWPSDRYNVKLTFQSFLQQITTANGYFTDVAEVRLGYVDPRTLKHDLFPVVMVAMEDRDVDVSRRATYDACPSHNDAEVTIYGYVHDKSDVDALRDKLEEDIVECLIANFNDTVALDAELELTLNAHWRIMNDGGKLNPLGGTKIIVPVHFETTRG